MDECQICDYGCNQKAKFQLKNGKYCCNKYVTKCPEVKRKNSIGVKKAYQENILDRNRFEGKRWNSKGKCLFSIDQVFKQGTIQSSELLRKYIKHFELKQEIYEICNIVDWNERDIVLEIHHKDGDIKNNQLNNLMFLCPNCHSQTDNFRGKNINTGNKIISDEKLLNALLNANNIRQALIEVGIAPKGGNYKRAKKLLKILK